ncbi:hypothetical protein G6F53_013794 [Rhizopus delemar]|nr:hypothetical protein G6F53_013794 [Rhizopus delemar]
MGDFRLAGRAHQALFQLLDSLFDLARLGADAARKPVLAAEFVQHRATNAGRGVGLELGVCRFLIAPYGVKQADHAGLYQVVELNAGG